MVPEGAQAVDDSTDGRPRFSICTMVSDMGMYQEMLSSFHSLGFLEPACEFLYVDNTSSNRFDGFRACNLFLRKAHGDFIVLTHQDVRLLSDGYDRLNAVIDELGGLDATWALFGNAGGLPQGGLAMRISDPHGADQRSGAPFPVRCVSLDENFIVVRADANLAVSGDLSGFHLFGTDLCVVASILGHTAYVVDFHLQHLSAGSMGPDFAASRRAIIRKYANALRPRLIHTTCAPIMLAPFGAPSTLSNSGKVMRVMLVVQKLLARSGH